MKISLTVLGVAALLVACSSLPSYVYVKEGASTQTMQATKAKCHYQVQLQKIPLAEQSALVEMCMKGEGYRRERLR